MVDDTFFARHAPVTLSEIERIVGAKSRLSGPDAGKLACGVASPAFARAGDICFLSAGNQSIKTENCLALACLVASGSESRLPDHVIPIVCDNPKVAFATVAALFHTAKDNGVGVSPSATIDSSCRIGEGCFINSGVSIAAGVSIGARCVIHANAVIGVGVSIGDDCVIGPNASLAHVIVGNRVVLHAGACIGQDGFGFVSGAHGHRKMPQLGRVLIGDDVEVGANSTIDRGTLEDTTIGDGTKIDNLVQIGHNCRIGHHCILCSQVGIAGSVTLGDGVILGGQVGIADHTIIGSGAQVLAKSGVSGNIPPGAKYAGIPAHPAREWYKTVAALWKLGKRKSIKAQVANGEVE